MNRQNHCGPPREEIQRLEDHVRRLHRDTASSGSDVDVVVAFDGPATSKRYFGVQFYLEDLLGCPVDLVTEKALPPELRPYIERERIND